MKAQQSVYFDWAGWYEFLRLSQLYVEVGERAFSTSHGSQLETEASLPPPPDQQTGLAVCLYTWPCTAPPPPADMEQQPKAPSGQIPSEAVSTETDDPAQVLPDAGPPTRSEDLDEGGGGEAFIGWPETPTDAALRKVLEAQESVRGVGDAVLDLLFPTRNMLRGVEADAGGTGCVIICLGALSVTGGLVLTPAGPNDWFFGELRSFVTVGGSFLGWTLGPSDASLQSLWGHAPTYDGGPSIYLSPGLSVGAGLSFQGFVSSQVRDIPSFEGWARAASLGVGPVVGSASQNTAGQWIYSAGLGISKGGPLGISAFNTYTWTTPLWR